MTDSTQLRVSDIKSLYTNIRHDLGLRALEFWLNKLEHQLPLLQRFSKQFILEGMFIVLNYNYFYINGHYFRQIKGTAMGTPCAVNYANLTVAYIEDKMFSLIPSIYLRDICDFFATNYLRFLDDVYYKWKTEVDIKPLLNLLNSIDPDIQFIFENLSTSVNFLDVNCTLNNDVLCFDIFHKPTHSFSYVRYHSCHPKHTLDNIALSLGKRIIQLVSENINERLLQLKSHLIQRGHCLDTINNSLCKLYSPSQNKYLEKMPITFVYTYNPNLRFNKTVIENSLLSLSDPVLQKVYEKKKPLITTRQPPNLKKYLTKAKFELNPKIELLENL